MCIRDRFYSVALTNNFQQADTGTKMIHLGKNTRSTIISKGCLLYTSDAADERSSVDLGGRRIIKKKKQREPLGDDWLNKTNTKKHI